MSYIFFQPSIFSAKRNVDVMAEDQGRAQAFALACHFLSHTSSKKGSTFLILYLFTVLYHSYIVQYSYTTIT